MVEGEKAVIDAAVAELKKEIDGRKAEVERERKRKEREEVRLRELKVVLEKRTGELKAKQAQVARGAEVPPQGPEGRPLPAPPPPPNVCAAVASACGTALGVPFVQ